MQRYMRRLLRQREMSICFGATVAIFSWYRPGVPSGLSTSTRSYVYFIFAFGSPQHAHDDELRAHRDPSCESSVYTMLNATQHDGSVQYAGTHHRQQQPNGQLLWILMSAFRQSGENSKKYV